MRAVGLAALALMLLASGCHRRTQISQVPPQELPPAQSTQPAYVPPPAPPAITQAPLPIPVTPVPPGGVSAEDLDYIATHHPIATQTGYATWYTADKGRKAANGEVFDGNALTAAHRTLPMGSLIEVTNLRTGQSSAMRITDRGPFVQGRILDLTVASAKAIGVYRPGSALVRLDVYEAPKPITTGGRWCVQIGAFHSEREALDLKAQLQREYPGSSVIEFPGENSFWVRIRPQGDDRALAYYIARHTHPVEGDAFLTRLD